MTDAAGLRGDGHEFSGIRAVEDQRVRARAAVEDVVAITRIPLEAVVAEAA